MKNIAIFGASQGLGSALANHFSQHNNLVYNFSRSCHSNEKITNVYYDTKYIDTIKKSLLSVDVTFDIIIYCPSAWEDEEKDDSEELLHFINTGPIGLKRTLDTIIDTDIINDGALFINIGSISSYKYIESKNPSYSISKKMQDMLIERYQNKIKNFRVTNMILGSIGEDLIDYDDIIKSVDLISSYNKSIVIENIVLKHETDQ